MEDITPETLAKMISDAGTNPAALAIAIGRDKDYIRDYLTGRKKSLKADDQNKILSAIEKPTLNKKNVIRLSNSIEGELAIIGTIQAGAWIEAFVREEDEPVTIPMTRDPRFPHAYQYALRVVGDSMNLEAPEGSYVICVNFAESGLSYKPGLLVHVERIMNGLSETTLKEIGYEDGRLVLKPRSSNPVYATIYPDEDESLETSIRGVVIGVYNPKSLL